MGLVLLIFPDGRRTILGQGAGIFSAVLPAQLLPGGFDEFRFFHGAYTGQCHDLGGGHHAFHADGGAGEGGVLPGVTHVAQTGY